MTIVRFVVRGIAVAQGSMTAVPRRRGGGVWLKAPPKLKPWRQAISFAARRAAGQIYGGYTGPVMVELAFHLKTPQRLFRLTDPASVPYTKKPDVDKLGRAVLDALTGVLYADDAQVISLTIVKHYSYEPRLEATVALANVR